MATLRHPHNIHHPVLFQARRTGATAHAVRDCSCARATHAKVCHRDDGKVFQRGDWLRSTGHVLLIGRDLLFALWAIAVLAFWLTIIAAIVL